MQGSVTAFEAATEPGTPSRGQIYLDKTKEV